MASNTISVYPLRTHTNRTQAYKLSANGQSEIHETEAAAEKELVKTVRAWVRAGVYPKVRIYTLTGSYTETVYSKGEDGKLAAQSTSSAATAKKPTPKSATARKSPAKKSPARKSPTCASSTHKSPAKKSPARKPPAKKSTTAFEDFDAVVRGATKKPSAKKPSAKKPSAKKSAAKKPSANPWLLFRSAALKLGVPNADIGALYKGLSSATKAKVKSARSASSAVKALL